MSRINQVLILLCCLVLMFVACVDAIRTVHDCPPIRMKNGRVRYRKNGFVQNTCDKGYILAGDKYMKCTNKKWEGITPVCVRNTCKKQREPINGYVYQSHRGGVLNFFCKPNYQLVGPAVAFCDGTAWSSHLPTCVISNSTVSLNCDFEMEDICGWTHDLNHNFDWTRHTRKTPSSFVGTGPSYDHTFGKIKPGYYMYIEASSKNPSDIARLISPVYSKQESNTCLEFWYHMYGATTGELRVYLVKEHNANWQFPAENAIFTRKGNRGNRWIRGLLNLGSIDDDFQIVMEGVRGGNYMSDIAIDDVAIIENCTEPEVVPTEETTTTDTSVTDDGGMDFALATCYNRCGEMDDVGICSCSIDCYEHNNCCTDYEAYCLDTDSTTLTESSMSTIDDTFTSSVSTIIDMSTTGQIETSFENNTREFQDNLITTTSEVSRTTTLAIAQVTDHPIIYTEKLRTLKQLTRKSTKFRNPSVPETTLRTMPNEISKNDSEYSVFKKTNNVGVVTSKNEMFTNDVATVQKSMSTMGLLGSICIGIAVTGFIFVILRKRCGTDECSRMRLRRSRSGNSESDVRFLTSDEVLDFSLASSYN